MDQATITAFKELQSKVHDAVVLSGDEESEQSQVLYVYYEFGQSLDYSIEEQRRKIREKEATPEALADAMHELSNMIEEFTHAAAKLLASIAPAKQPQINH